MQVMPKKFTDEEKSRAVRMVHEQRSEYPTLRATCEAVGSRLGIGRETLRGWVGQAKVDAGEAEGPTTAEREELRQLKAEVRRLREDNAILKAAAAFSGTRSPPTAGAPRPPTRQAGPPPPAAGPSPGRGAVPGRS